MLRRSEAAHSTHVSLEETRSEADIFDPPSNCLVSMVWGMHNRLGVAYYTPDEGFIEVAECFDYDAFLNARAVKEDRNPFIVFVPSSSDRRFLEMLKQPIRPGGPPVEVALMRTEDFSIEQAMARLRTLYSKLLGRNNERFVDERDVLMGLSGDIDVNSKQLIRAVGGLLVNLEHGAFSSRAGTTIKAEIRGIRPAALGKALCVDIASLEALQVFKLEQHPAGHHGIGSAKEGVSVYGLLNRCKSRLGSASLKQWLSHPTCDLQVLTDRRAAVDVLSAPHNQESVANLRDFLRFVKDPVPIFNKFRRRSQSLEDWLSLYQTVHSLPPIVTICNALLQQGGTTVLSNLVAAYRPAETEYLLSHLYTILDLPSSAATGRLVVKSGVDPQLDRHRKAYENLEPFLFQVAGEVREELHREAPDESGMFGYEVSVEYYPQLGYFVSIPIQFFQDHGTTTLGGGAYRYEFKTDEALFYKNPRMEGLDQQYGDLYGSIVDLEAEIILKLIDVVLQPEVEQAICVARLCGQVDCAVAVATTCAEERWCRPEIVEENVLVIEGGRHPLQEKFVDQFVPNNTVMEEGARRVHVITGPNGSGKSVYIKQVALCVFLAHVGCYVPAAKATIGMCDRIFTRVQTFQTRPSAAPSSAFSADMTQMSVMLKYSTSRSLLVIDEFGKGTCAADGVALLAASVKHLMAWEVPPRALVATHFTELFERSLVPRSPHLSEHHMAVTVSKGRSGSDVCYKFCCEPGIASRSYATFVASQEGVPRRVVSRADHIFALLHQGLTIAAVCDMLGEKDALAKYSRLFDLLLHFPPTANADDAQQLRAKVAAITA